MKSSDLSKQFSLDYLLSGSKANAPAEPVRSSPTDSVFELLNQPILRKLAEAPGGKMSLHALLDALASIYPDLRVEALSELIQRLESGGRIRVLTRDRYGNHELQFIPPPT